VRPLIIALGRSDNHPLLARHARALGVAYLGLEGFEASDLLRSISREDSREDSRDSGAFAHWVAQIPKDQPTILAAIDTSISAATLNSLHLALSEAGISRLSLRTDPLLLELSSRYKEELDEESDVKTLHLLSIARSPHRQIAIWPIITVDRDGKILDEDAKEVFELSRDDEKISHLLDQVIQEAGEVGLVGVATYIVEPERNSIIRREFGASTFTFWSESASYTSITEQLVRSLLDLPLGDARTIDFEEFFLEEEIDIEPGLIVDPIRPFLHLFARNPRLKVAYLGDASGTRFERARLALFASSDIEARHEMDHAKEFMLGRADEHAS
jgi:hypothetical protein